MLYFLLSHFSATQMRQDPIAPYYITSTLFDQSRILQHPSYQHVLCKKGFTEKHFPVSAPKEETWFAHTRQWLQKCTSCLRSSSIVDIENPLFLKEQGEKLEKTLEKSYFANRKKLYQNAIKQMLISNSSVPLISALGIAIPHLMGISMEYYDALMISNVFFIVFRNLNPLSDLIASFWSPANDPLVVYELQYMKLKLYINFLDAEEDQKNFDTYRMTPYPEQQFLIARKSTNDQPTIMRFLYMLLRIPTTSIKPCPDYNSLVENLKLYVSRSQEQILGACMHHVDSYQEQLGLNPKPRQFLSFRSRPGTGKSNCVESIAKNLGLPFVVISLSGETRESLFGNELTPGLFLERIIQLGARNGIFFFDELDRAVENNRELLNIILPFAEPSTKTFYSPYFKRTVDVSHLFFIVAGNMDFTEEAMQSRFHLLKTVDLTITNKEKMLDLVCQKCPKEWRSIIDTYLSHQAYLSFRDAYSKIDELNAQKKLLDFKQTLMFYNPEANLSIVDLS